MVTEQVKQSDNPKSQTPSFPIDAVFTWVDGAQNHAERLNFLQAQGTINDNERNQDDMAGQNRFRDNNEIMQAIASIRRFAPFIRKIFIVAAAGQVPPWLNKEDNPDVEMVFHPTLFGNQSADCLPTFNSHAIEAMLAFIPKLSEQFIYFNDDMFLGAPILPTDLFDNDGTAIVRLRGQVARKWQNHKKSWRVYRGNLYNAMTKRLGEVSVIDTAHQGRTLLKSVCLEAWNDPAWRELLLSTVRTRFRTLNNIPPIELFSNLMITQKKARTIKETGVVLQLFDHSILGPEFYALNLIQPKFYCINDDTRHPSRAHLARFRAHLATNLPHHRRDNDSNAATVRKSPRWGRLMLEMAHHISWLNRMGHQLLSLITPQKRT